MPLVRRPSRYTGGEWNQVVKETADVRIALAYPDAYEVGMSNFGLKVLYEIVNADERFSAERVYSPWVDMEALMREEGMPLFTLETGTPIRDLDVFGISLQSELTYTNVIGLLDLAGIARRTADRESIFPLVVGGGPGAFNPEPMSSFFDLFVVGEAEEAIIELLEAVAEFKKSAGSAGALTRLDLLSRLAEVEGVYVPSLGRRRVKRRLIRNFDLQKPPSRPIVPFLETIHDRCVVEVTRGCGRGCRFCQAGMVYRPVRERGPGRIVEAAVVQASNTGYDELSLASLSTTDHSALREILSRMGGLPDRDFRSISLPSMRTDRFSVEIAQALAGRKKTGLTFAPEAGTARLRAIINKGLTEEEILTAAEEAFRAGWDRLKLYFMIGLPGETDEDIEGIGRLVGRMLDAARNAMGTKRSKRVRIVVSASTFVPKPHTPFQWCGALPLHEIERRQRHLRSVLPQRQVDFKWHEAGGSLVEAAIARGDRRVCDAIEKAYELGARFDGWSDMFDFDVWVEAFQAVGLDLEGVATADTPFEVQGDSEEHSGLPWGHIDCGLDEEWLRSEYEKALKEEETPDCRLGRCGDCGVCGDGVKLELAVRSSD